MESVFTLGASAFVLGVMHALEPGHGKTAMVGALLGSKRRWLDPIRLGCAAAVGHLLGVLIVGSLSFFLAHHFAPAKLRQFIEVGIGTALILFGIFIFVNHLKTSKTNSDFNKSCSCCKSGQKGTKYIPALGLLVGFIPCPSAMALSVSAISLGSPGRAIVLASMFSIGVAFTLAAVGIALTHSSEKLGTHPVLGWLTRNNFFVSSFIFIVIGIFMILHAELGDVHGDH